MKKYTFILVLIIFCRNALLAQESILNVVPQPQKITFTNNNFEIKNKTINLKLLCNSYEPLKIAQEDLKITAKLFCNAELSDKNAG